MASKDRHERAQAAIEAGQKGVNELSEELMSLLDDKDDLVAVAAFSACRQLGNKHPPIDRAVEALASSDEETVMAAVFALGKLGESQLPELFKLLDAGSTYSAQILRILGDIGGPKCLQAIQNEAESSDSKLASIAQQVLAQWED